MLRSGRQVTAAAPSDAQRQKREPSSPFSSPQSARKISERRGLRPAAASSCAISSSDATPEALSMAPW